MMPTSNRIPTAPTLPWIRDRDELPGALPTTAEIGAATREFPSIFDPSARRTVLVNQHFVVKYGRFVFENEGHALLFLDSVHGVPAPRLYAMYRENDKLYIVMEFIQGHQLSDTWSSLSEDEKSPLVNQLRAIFDCLRALPSPDMFGGVCGGALPNRWFFSREKDRRITGPFDREEDLCRALVLKSRYNWELAGRRGWMTDFFERHLSNTLRGHASVFTHSDFQRKNILIREKQRPLSTADSGDSRRHFEVVAILDWEDAGWYPSYWNYSYCFSFFNWCDDWAEKVEHILDPYVPEGTLLRMVAQDLDS
ncbi:hypothetical protein FZEAL_6551 [Fusarium zealandicum]|uniref:Aminoglycoside phosphotransferase domain-containing protein n=1 Tax=Fusarium zealandicum TaxID=1053134 RepID=A0A8H4UHV1_9HYPO|nr:hypothetical protein FZEAL_6551 [Fusarium zealandicum]